MSQDKQREFNLLSEKRFANYRCNKVSQDALSQLETERRELVEGKLDAGQLRRQLDELKAKKISVMQSSQPAGKLTFDSQPQNVRPLKPTADTFRETFAQSCSPNLSFVLPIDRANRDPVTIGSEIRFHVSDINGHFDCCFDSLIVTGTFLVTEGGNVGLNCDVTPTQLCQANGLVSPHNNDLFYGDIYEYHQPFMFIDSVSIDEPKVFVMNPTGSEILSLHTAQFFKESASGGLPPINTNPPFLRQTLKAETTPWITPGPGGTEVCIGVGVRHWVRVTVQNATIDVTSIGQWQVSNIVPYIDTHVIH